MKAVYVALARLEEEKLAWEAMQDFYKERIDTMRDHAGMSPVVWPLWKQPTHNAQKPASAKEQQSTSQIDEKALITELSNIEETEA